MARIKLVYLGGGSTRAAGTMASFMHNGADFDGSEVVLVDLDASRLELVRTLAPLRPQAAFLVISGRIGRKEVLGSGLEIGERLKYLKKPFLLSELPAVVTEFERYWPAGTN